MDKLNSLFSNLYFIIGILGFIILLLIVILILYKKSRKSRVKESDTEAVLASLKDGLIVVDSSNRFISFNPQAEAMLGMRGDKLLGKQATQLVLKKKEWQNLAQVMFYGEEKKSKEGDKAGEINEIAIEKPESLILQVLSTPVRDIEGRLRGFMHILHDVTEERMLEHIKRSFIAILSHSLRTPLAGIKWSISALLKEKMSPEDQRPMFEQIQKQHNLLEGMVEALITASEIQRGKLAFRMAPVKLGEMMDELAKEYQRQAEAKKLTLGYKRPKGITPLNADKVKLKLAIGNILNNAVKYTKQGGIKLTLETGRKEAKITIADTGVGIPKDQQEKLFSKFFWAKNVIMHQHEGAGLGLYIAKEIIDAHKGKIEIHSEEGKGTTVNITLALAKK